MLLVSSIFLFFLSFYSPFAVLIVPSHAHQCIDNMMTRPSRPTPLHHVKSPTEMSARLLLNPSWFSWNWIYALRTNWRLVHGLQSRLSRLCNYCSEGTAQVEDVWHKRERLKPWTSRLDCSCVGLASVFVQLLNVIWSQFLCMFVFALVENFQLRKW